MLEAGSMILVVGGGFHFDVLKGVAKHYLDNGIDPVAALEEPWPHIEVFGGGQLHFMDLFDSHSAKQICSEMQELGGPNWVVIFEDKPGQFMRQVIRYVYPSLSSHTRIMVSYTSDFNAKNPKNN